jgi:lipopolysaccharide/colanic/teichoic acid biosynthesis glycosyltransferase
MTRSVRVRRVAVVAEVRARDVIVRALPAGSKVVDVLRPGEAPRVIARRSRYDEVVVDAAGLRALQQAAMWTSGMPPVSAVDVDAVDNVAAWLKPPIGLVGRIFKRTLDITLATVAGILVLPVLLAAWVAIRVDSPGAALFSQTRIGLGGRPFRCFKLRTMYVGNDAAEHRAFCDALMDGAATRRQGLYKLVDDPRVTRVGRTLRRLSIDELPQLWNVLLGQMSIIGPRPCLPDDVARCDTRYWSRLRVRPGLTGPWQVSGRARLSFDDMVRLDVDYWQRWSPSLDLWVLLRTPLAVFDVRSTA